MLSVCKTFRFEAAHHLPGHKGKCQKFHGHSYVLEIEVEGKENIVALSRNLQEAMVIDFGDLKEIVGLEIHCLDHSNLNDFYSIPTAEVMVLDIVSSLKERLPGLCRVRLYETVSSYAEWKK